MKENPLGKTSDYPSHYNPELLFPIPRAPNRKNLGIESHELPFRGYDLWRAYEVSCLNNKGKPLVATAEFIVPANSEFIIESKSLKLYLNSLNNTRFTNLEDLQETIGTDLSAIAGSTVIVQLNHLHSTGGFSISRPDGICLDGLDVKMDSYTPNVELLSCRSSEIVEETLFSDLFKSNCPVTGQPDWGSAIVHYKGPAIDHEGLLAYLVSFRQHEGFHEDCTEHVFQDLMASCKPESLSVAIHFLRRGGLEINPVRSTTPIQIEFPAERFLRQ